MAEPGSRTVRQVRWRRFPDGSGEEWSRWHAVTGPCPACCCGLTLCGSCSQREHREPGQWPFVYDTHHINWCEHCGDLLGELCGFETRTVAGPAGEEASSSPSGAAQTTQAALAAALPWAALAGSRLLQAVRAECMHSPYANEFTALLAYREPAVSVLWEPGCRQHPESGRLIHDRPHTCPVQDRSAMPPRRRRRRR